MQAVSCGARSRQYSRLLSASSSQPRSIVERAGLWPMGRVHIYRYIDILRSSDAPRSPSLARHPLCAGHREGLLCGKGVEPPRGRGKPSGARESQVFFGYITCITKICAEIHSDITTTTTIKYHYYYYYYYYYYYRAASYSKDSEFPPERPQQ